MYAIFSLKFYNEVNFFWHVQKDTLFYPSLYHLTVQKIYRKLAQTVKMLIIVMTIYQRV